MAHSVSWHPDRRPWFVFIASMALVAITTAAYAGVFQNDFVSFDDDIYVTNNPYTKAGLSWDGFFYAWTTFDLGNWIPLTVLSYQLDVTLFGFRPATFHATNLAIHCTNVLLLFTWLVSVTGARWRSLTVAALFAVHPLRVESVAWIAERKDLLSAFWLLISLFMYEKHARQPDAKWYLATCVAFVLGLLSKSMLVTVPVLLLLIDVWPLGRLAPANQAEPFQTEELQVSVNKRAYPRRTGPELLLEKLPLLAIALLDVIVTIFAQSCYGISTGFESMANLPLWARCTNSMLSYCWYITKTFWPTNLSVLYLHPLKDQAWGNVAVAAILLVVVSSYVGRNGFRRRHLLFGWLWFLIALLPVIGLLQVGRQAYADRYSYIPHMGLLIMIVWESRYWLDRLPAGRGVARVAVTVAVFVGAWLTVLQVTVWQTSVTLFSHALEVDPKNWFAHEQVGILRLNAGNLDEAFKHFQLELQQRPGHADAFCNVAWIHLQREEWELAEQYYRQALAIDSAHPSAMQNLVALLQVHGRIKDAADCLEFYVATRPEHSYMVSVLSQIHINTGVELEAIGELAAARAHFAAAVKLTPADNEAREHLNAIEQRLNGSPGS